MHNLLKKCVLIGPISFDCEKVRNVNKLTSLQNGENGNHFTATDNIFSSHHKRSKTFNSHADPQMNTQVTNKEEREHDFKKRYVSKVQKRSHQSYWVHVKGKAKHSFIE